MNKQFVLETDASQHHVATVLMQYANNNLPQVIAYFSKKLRPVELRYSATGREALAIVLGCQIYHTNRPSTGSISFPTSDQVPRHE